MSSLGIPQVCDLECTLYPYKMDRMNGEIMSLELSA